MIVCDKCGEKAEYFLNVDYLRNKSIATFDLCEKHYNELQVMLVEEDQPPVAVNAPVVDVVKVKKRGRPKKHR